MRLRPDNGERGIRLPQDCGRIFGRANLKYISALLEVLPMDSVMMDEAIQAGGQDFEDSFQAIAAASAGCDAIVTRNIRDFENLAPQTHSLPTLLDPVSLLTLFLSKQ